MIAWNVFFIWMVLIFSSGNRLLTKSHLISNTIRHLHDEENQYLKSWFLISIWHSNSDHYLSKILMKMNDLAASDRPTCAFISNAKKFVTWRVLKWQIKSLFSPLRDVRWRHYAGMPKCGVCFKPTWRKMPKYGLRFFDTCE